MSPLAQPPEGDAPGGAPWRRNAELSECEIDAGRCAAGNGVLVSGACGGDAVETREPFGDDIDRGAPWAWGVYSSLMPLPTGRLS